MNPPKKQNSYRILHTADWHLGKMLNDQTRDDEHGMFLEWLLEQVEVHEVDAIILAGDVFDSANPPQQALSRYYDFVSQLHRTRKCELVVISGNHDSAALLEAPKRVLKALNVHVVGYLAGEVSERVLSLPTAADPQVAIAMIPFLRDRDLRVGRAGESGEEIRRQVVDGIRTRYDEVAEWVKGWQMPVIAMGHLTVMGASTSDSEREIHVGGLGAVASDAFAAEYDYVALGHLHRPQATDAAGRVRYAGSPIALSFSESRDVKEVRVLDVTSDGIGHWSLPIPVFRRLAQVHCTCSNLETALQAYEQESVGKLPPWLEVVVIDAGLETDLVSRVQELAEGKPYQVLKVMRERVTSVVGMAVGGSSDEEALETILDQPQLVFQHLLDEHTELNQDEKETLRNTFSILLELHQQSETR